MVYYGKSFIRSGVQSVLAAQNDTFIVQYCYKVPDYVKKMYMVQIMFQIYCNSKYHRYEADYVQRVFDRFFFWGHTILVDKDGKDLPIEQYPEYMKYWGLQLSQQQVGILNTLLSKSRDEQLKEFGQLVRRKKDKPQTINRYRKSFAGLHDDMYDQNDDLGFGQGWDEIEYLPHTDMMMFYNLNARLRDRKEVLIGMSKILTFTMKDNIMRLIVDGVVCKNSNGKYHDFFLQISKDKIKQEVVDTIAFFCTTECFLVPYDRRHDYDLHKCVRQLYTDDFDEQVINDLVNNIIDSLKEIYVQLYTKGLIE